MTPRPAPSLPLPPTHAARSARRLRRSAASAVAVSIVLAACGGDDGGGGDEPSARERRAICRGGSALYAAAERGDLDDIDDAIASLEDADAERLTGLDLEELTVAADDGDLRTIEDAFDDAGCDDVAAVTTVPATTEPPVTEPPAPTQPSTTEPATTEPATTPATTEPATTEPATTEPATTEPATPGEPSGFVLIDFDAAALPPATAINPLLDGQPVDVLTSYGIDGVLVPASPNAQILELQTRVSRSFSGEGISRTETITYVVDTAVEPDDLRQRFRDVVDGLDDYDFRDSSSERDGISTLSFDADAAGFDQTIPNWGVSVAFGEATPYVLVSVRRQWFSAPGDLATIPAPIEEVLATSLGDAEAAGWTRRGYSVTIGVNQFNGQPSNLYSTDYATETTDLDEAVAELVAASEGAAEDDTTSTDTRAVIDAEGGRYLFISTGDNPVTITYNAPR